MNICVLNIFKILKFILFTIYFNYSQLTKKEVFYHLVVSVAEVVVAVDVVAAAAVDKEVVVAVVAVAAVVVEAFLKSA